MGETEFKKLEKGMNRSLSHNSQSVEPAREGSGVPPYTQGAPAIFRTASKEGCLPGAGGLGD